MKEFLKNWNFTRILRLVLGIFIIGQGIADRNWIFIALGILFSLMPLLNIGCCGVSGCDTAVPKQNQKIEDITYEEIK
ncbi:MAG TPA: hypothetical protein PLP27_08150 [Crocinitomicaceae bacterium]|nr:hypothetical protein [Crocinitomicaceae bacterium]